jgi:hypothetical protein
MIRMPLASLVLECRLSYNACRSVERIILRRHWQSQWHPNQAHSRLISTSSIRCPAEYFLTIRHFDSSTQPKSPPKAAASSSRTSPVETFIRPPPTPPVTSPVRHPRILICSRRNDREFSEPAPRDVEIHRARALNLASPSIEHTPIRSRTTFNPVLTV